MDSDYPVDENKKLAPVSKELSAKLDKQAVIEVVCRAARDLAQADGACVILREGEHVHYSREEAIAPLWAGQRFPITNCISGWSILHRAPAVIEDIYSDERISADYYRGTFVKSLAIAPIQQHSPVGAIGVYWARRHRATGRQLDLLETLADLAAVAFTNADLFDEMKSARLKAEAQAEELRNQAELIDQSYDALIVWELGGAITSWSKGAEELYGFSKHEAVGRVIHNLLNTTFSDAAEGYEKTLGRTGRWEGEPLRTRKDGGRIVVYSRCKVVNQNGRSYVLESNRDITDRKRAEQALRQTEHRFEMFMQNLPGLAWVKDLAGRYLFVNDAAEAAFGLPRAELLGKTDEHIFPPETAAAFRENDRRAMATGAGVQAIETLEQEDGAHHSIVSKFPILGPDGRPEMIGGVAFDITDRELAEEALRQSEERFSKAFRASPHLMTISTLGEGRYVDVNDAVLRSTGYAREEMIGRRADELRIFAEPGGRAKLVSAFKGQGTVRDLEATIRTKDGRVLTILLSAEIITLNGEKCILTTSNDITDRKRAEEALRQSEQRFAAAFQASPLALTITSLRTGRLLEVNETFTRLSGYTREEAVGRTTLELGLWSRASDREAELAMVSQRGKVREAEYRFRMKDGTELVGLLSAGQIEIGGEPCALTVIEDITEKKRAEAERERLMAIEQEARLQAEAASRMKDEFLATISHELRTPLNAILGWSTMLCRGKLDEPNATRALETIERNARAQAQLIEDLLDVSRIISGKLRLDVKPIALTPVIKAAIDSVLPAAHAKGIQLQMVVDPAADSISGDSNRLQQVVWNLLSNAVKFTAKGGRVQIRLDRADSQAQITVSDTGEGISPEFLPYVFDRFRQEDGKITRRHGGLGLGLAIVRHLIEMHGGTIEARSAGVGQGATFTIRLPLAGARSTETDFTGDTEDVSLVENDRASIDSSILYGLRILAVDDEPDARELVKGVLEQYGADVVTATSAGDGLDALLGCKPDVLVCDIGMPEEDGYSLIRKVRALSPEKGGGTPAVALTGYVRVEERIRALEAGYQMFVPKPVEADELVLIVASLVGRTQRGRSA
jgi:PAS domain S-box-containing protein